MVCLSLLPGFQSVRLASDSDTTHKYLAKIAWYGQKGLYHCIHHRHCFWQRGYEGIMNNGFSAIGLSYDAATRAFSCSFRRLHVKRSPLETSVLQGIALRSPRHNVCFSVIQHYPANPRLYRWLHPVIHYDNQNRTGHGILHKTTLWDI